MTKEIKTDILRVCAGNFILGAVMVLVFLLVGHFSYKVILGALLGCSYISLSFCWLAASVTKNIEKDPDNAQKRVSATYTYRLLLAAAMIILAIKAPVFNWVAACIPLFYSRIVIMAVGRRRTKEVKKSEC